MELICSSSDRVNTKVTEIEACCQKNNIKVKVKQLQGQGDLKSLELNIKEYCVLLIDDKFVELLENCAKIVAKIIKIISIPNKLIFMKDVAEEKFEELMEMFDKPQRNIITTVEELVRFCSTKFPTESDELTNTTTSFASVNIRSVEPLSGSSLLNEPAVIPRNVHLNRPSAEPVESRHSFSSDEVYIEANGKPNGVQKSNSSQNIPLGLVQQGPLDQRQWDRQVKSLPDNCQSVTTNQIYPTLRPQSFMTSYVAAGISQPGSPDVNRSTPQSYMSGQSFNSSGPYAMPCQSGNGIACHCSMCPSIHQHSDSFPRLNSSQPKSVMMSETGRSYPMNNFRQEIWNLDRQYTQPPYNPNIQSDGSDNRAVSCGRCGHSVFMKQEQNDIGPLSETFHSADGASGMTEKEYFNPDKVSILELKEEVMVMVRDSLDCADHYNWKKLADLHKWSFGKIYQLEQKWKNRKIDSPFMCLIEEFQNYTLLDLKEDLQRIPRKDLLQQIESLQNKGLLFHT